MKSPRARVDLRWLAATASALLLACSGVAAQTPVEDFRVDTSIHQQEDGPALLEVRTLLTQTPTGDVVYDFQLGDSPQTTVFDIARGRVALIDPSRRVTAELQATDVFTVAMAICERAPKEQADLFAPKFDVRRADNRLTLQGEALTYEVELLAPKFPSAAGRYQTLATWAARLNSVRGGSLPSTGREQVNEQVAAARCVPALVRRTIHRGRLKGEVVSKHRYVWALSGADRGMINTAHSQLASFSRVPIESYLQLKPSAGQQAGN